MHGGIPQVNSLTQNKHTLFELRLCWLKTMTLVKAEVKAAVLLIEQPYLAEHVCYPGRYFPFLTKKKVLSDADCSSIKQQRCVEHQVQKFVELISLKECGYDMFLEALKKEKVNIHVRSYLSKRVLEVAELYSQG